MAIHYQKVLLTLLLLLAWGVSCAQESYHLKCRAVRNITPIEKDQVFVIKEFKWRIQGKGQDLKYNISAQCDLNGEQLAVGIATLRKDATFEIANSKDLVLATLLKHDFPSLTRSDLQGTVREELRQEANEYQQYVYTQNGILHDPCLESYIYSLIYKILPFPSIPFKSEHISLIIDRNTGLNIGTYPDGTMFITTGLISALESEDELVALLSHEVAHFILDHSIQNITRQISRQKKSEFWSSIAIGSASIAGIVAAEKTGNYYLPGLAAVGTALISSTISTNIIERLGMDYAKEQEIEADNFALKSLELLNYDKNALATAFTRILESEFTGNNPNHYWGKAGALSIRERILNAGEFNPVKDPKYIQKTSLSNAANTLINFNNKHFFLAYGSSLKNIENQVETIDDLIIHAACIQMIDNSDKTSAKSLYLLDKALSLSPNNLNAVKYKAITLIRNNDKENASTILNDYRSLLLTELNHINQYIGQKTWEDTFAYLNQELEWSNHMIRQSN